MTSTNNNGGVRFVEDVMDEAQDTIARLRDLKPREHIVEIPDKMELWRRSAAEIERAHEQATLEQQQRDAEIAGAVELQAAEAEAESDQQWNAWVDGKLAGEREMILQIMGEVVAKAMVEVREESETKVTAITKQLDQERAARRRDRDHAREQAKAAKAAHAQDLETLRAELRGQQRALELMEIRSRETKAEAERRIGREEMVVSMARMMFEEFLLRR
jgi:hypothetical protein